MPQVYWQCLTALLVGLAVVAVIVGLAVVAYRRFQR
jgi:multisubunit Na+/H+ antiporter MnhC subunit